MVASFCNSYSPGVDLEDVDSALLIWQTELIFGIEPAGAQQGRVQGVRSVGGHQHLNVASRIEAVQLSIDLRAAVSTLSDHHG